MDLRILHYDTLDSTNDTALAFARDGAEEGVVVCAEFQKKGRGRFDRTWIAPKGKGLLFSIVLRPKLKANQTPILTHVAAETVMSVLRNKYKIGASLKKPNDVLVGKKKICGILTESSSVGQKIDYVILGIGLNINQMDKDLPEQSTSMRLERGQKFEKDHVLEDLLEQFRDSYEKIS